MVSDIYMANTTAGECLFLEDIDDVLVSNFLGEVASGAYACLHIKGVCNDIELSNVAVSAAQQSGSWACLIEKSTNGTPGNISWHGGEAISADIGIQVTDLTGSLRIANVDVEFNNITGLYVPSTGTISTATLRCFGVLFKGNNAAAGTGYDADIEATASALNGSFTGCTFASTGITHSMKLVGNNLLTLSQCVNASGKSASQFFTGAVAKSTRDCSGLNPWGAWNPQPSFSNGVALTNTFGADSTVYLMSGSVTGVTIQGSVGTAVAVNTSGPWRWPAGSAITFSFTSATFETIGD